MGQWSDVSFLMLMPSFRNRNQDFVIVSGRKQDGHFSEYAVEIELQDSRPY